MFLRNSHNVGVFFWGVRSECLMCTFRANCCSARLSRASTFLGCFYFYFIIIIFKIDKVFQKLAYMFYVICCVEKM